MHESLVEYAHHAGGLITAIEWLFLLSGGLTAAYMLKLFITIFVEKPTAETPVAHHKLSPLSAASLLLAVVALPVLGVLPHGLAERISGWMLSFVGGHDFHHGVHYFAFVNLKGVLISLGIGIAVYLLIIRRLLTKQEGDRRIHYNPLEGVFSLEENLYKPIFRGTIWILGGLCSLLDRVTDAVVRGGLIVLTVVCRLLNDLTDLLVLLARKTVLRTVKDTHNYHERPGAFVLGRLYGRIKKKNGDHYGEVFVRVAETIVKTTRRLSGNFSFALLMTFFGICVILLTILWVAFQ